MAEAKAARVAARAAPGRALGGVAGAALWCRRSPPGRQVKEQIMTSEGHKGSCFCGAVEIEVTGAPAAMGYCHCASCRHWSAGPINAFTLWPPGAVRVTRGDEHIGVYNQTARSDRKWCTRCGGHLMTAHPWAELIDVYAAMIPTFKFEPTLHINYAEAVLPVRDGLPKLKDVPAAMGGSGETMAE
jgi:hypothetical protein